MTEDLEKRLRKVIKLKRFGFFKWQDPHDVYDLWGANIPEDAKTFLQNCGYEHVRKYWKRYVPVVELYKELDRTYPQNEMFVALNKILFKKPVFLEAKS